MDQWLLAVTSDPAAKGSAKDLEVAGAGPVHCHFSLPPSFLTMCSSERCLSLASPWYIDHVNHLYVSCRSTASHSTSMQFEELLATLYAKWPKCFRAIG